MKTTASSAPLGAMIDVEGVSNSFGETEALVGVDMSVFAAGSPSLPQGLALSDTPPSNEVSRCHESSARRGRQRHELVGLRRGRARDGGARPDHRGGARGRRGGPGAPGSPFAGTRSDGLYRPGWGRTAK